MRVGRPLLTALRQTPLLTALRQTQPSAPRTVQSGFLLVASAQRRWSSQSISEETLKHCRGRVPFRLKNFPRLSHSVDIIHFMKSKGFEVTKDDVYPLYSRQHNEVVEWYVLADPADVDKLGNDLRSVVAAHGVYNGTILEGKLADALDPLRKRGRRSGNFVSVNGIPYVNDEQVKYDVAGIFQDYDVEKDGIEVAYANRRCAVLVELRSVGCARRAVRELHGTYIENCRLKVRWVQ